MGLILPSNHVPPDRSRLGKAIRAAFLTAMVRPLVIFSTRSDCAKGEALWAIRMTLEDGCPKRRAGLGQSGNEGRRLNPPWWRILETHLSPCWGPITGIDPRSDEFDVD